MKNILFTIIGTITLFFAGRNLVFGQAKADSNSTLQISAIKPVSIQSFEAFKASIKPLIEKMSAKQIVGLGEGTHGTAEFYKVRFWISRILIEEKGFNHIAFENDYSDSWLLNNELNTTTNLDALMKKRLLSIWQNQETKELLAWVKQYNSKHHKKVTIDGLDYVYITPDVEVLKQLLTKTPAVNLLDSMDVITKAAKFQDEVWEGSNHSEYKVNMDSVSKSSYAGYVAAVKLDKALNVAVLPQQVKDDCHMAILNIEQAFAPFYDEAAKLPEASRDDNMAQNAALIMKKPGTKMIIWAHNVHLAKTGIYNNEVGGTGGIILKMFPNNYFILGTGTATGTFAATKESRDTYTNPMAAYPLEVPVKGSWENLFSAMGKPVFYVEPSALNPQKLQKQMRFVGYTPESGPKSYDKTNMNDLFDAYLFINETHAPAPLK
ncbi:Erythromycin esterase homolog [Mucilaginibacter pineti]|uniref:Erythromycin esterase homolog n=1 Tax=Mucilaginibacter pineti TaxID=1391627 RepID=A0A1G7FWD2_9SPHI|nr:erythromycin esterase family protein [Mucilaginibacter pineti]SDE80196.1 Erythromycin esterase homolog [Mucilaginibacter pineti]